MQLMRCAALHWIWPLAAAHRHVWAVKFVAIGDGRLVMGQFLNVYHKKWQICATLLSGLAVRGAYGSSSAYFQLTANITHTPGVLREQRSRQRDSRAESASIQLAIIKLRRDISFGENLPTSHKTKRNVALFPQKGSCWPNYMHK